MAIEFKNLDDLLEKKQTSAAIYQLALKAEGDALANYTRSLEITRQAYAEYRGTEIAFDDAIHLHTKEISQQEDLREAAE